MNHIFMEHKLNLSTLKFGCFFPPFNFPCLLFQLLRKKYGTSLIHIILKVDKITVQLKLIKMTNRSKPSLVIKVLLLFQLSTMHLYKKKKPAVFLFFLTEFAMCLPFFLFSHTSFCPSATARFEGQRVYIPGQIQSVFPLQKQTPLTTKQKQKKKKKRERERSQGY